MKFSKAWLLQHVDIEIATPDLVAGLTMAGLEVDGVEPAAPPFTKVVVGEVVAIEPHPDADQLRVCNFPQCWMQRPPLSAHTALPSNTRQCPRLCLEPAGDTRIGALVALPEPAKFRLGSLLPGSYTLHHHLYETGIFRSEDGTWGGQPLTIAKDAAGQAGELGRAPGHELTVVVRDRDGRPLQGRLTIRDRMFECWADDLRQNTTLDDAADPIPTPPGTELVDGTGTLKNVRSGRIAFVLQLDDGQSVHFVRDVDVTKPLEVKLAALPR